MSSSFGSIQNAVVAAPPQRYSPTLPKFSDWATSVKTATPNPNPCPEICEAPNCKGR